MKRKDQININLELHIGEGESNNFSCCLIRPFLKFFSTGKPPGKINYIFYRHVDNQCYNLGALCYTKKARRLLFFPGFQARDLLWLLNKQEERRRFDIPDYSVDHYTLERDLKRYHITLLKKDGSGRKEYPLSYKTMELGENIFFCLDLSIQNPSLLEPT